MPDLLRLFCAASAALTLLGLAVRVVCVYALHLYSYPYSFFALPHDGLGIDLMLFYVRFQHFHSVDFFAPQWGSQYAYPAAVAPIYWLFYRVRYAQIPFLLIVPGIMVVLLWKFTQALRRAGASRNDAVLFTAVCALCSYPFFFEFSRANMEIFMWLLSALAVYAILRDRLGLGSVLLGAAIAMKLYPFVLLGLFISRRRYRYVAYSVLAAALFTLASLWLLCPDIRIAWNGINAGVAQFQTRFVTHYLPVYSGVDHSLFALLKRILGPLPQPRYASILAAYMKICAVTGLLLYCLRIWKLPVLNQVLCLTVASVLLPPVSFEYTLMHLYTPFALWALYLVHRYHSGRGVAPGVRGMAVCFVLLLSQVGEVIWHGDRLGGQIKAVALLVLFVLGLWFPLPSEFDRPDPLARAVPA